MYDSPRVKALDILVLLVVNFNFQLATHTEKPRRDDSFGAKDDGGCCLFRKTVKVKWEIMAKKHGAIGEKKSAH